MREKALAGKWRSHCMDHYAGALKNKSHFYQRQNDDSKYFVLLRPTSVHSIFFLLGPTALYLQAHSCP